MALDELPQQLVRHGSHDDVSLILRGYGSAIVRLAMHQVLTSYILLSSTRASPARNIVTAAPWAAKCSQLRFAFLPFRGIKNIYPSQLAPIRQLQEHTIKITGEESAVGS